MKLKLQRYNHKSDSTGGLLFVDGAFFCYTCEDQAQPDGKVAGETRIPAGTYEIKLRDEGELTKKYAKMFPTLHKGMLHLQDVPEFTWIYIHLGNDDDDTDGCILTGERPTDGDAKQAGVWRSTDAYKRLYRRVVKALENDEQVTIEVG